MNTTTILTEGVPANRKFTSNFTLLIDPQSLAWLSRRQPLEIAKLEPTLLRARYDSRDWVLHLMSETEWKHWDQEADDEELAILLAIRWLQNDDEDRFL